LLKTKTPIHFDNSYARLPGQFYTRQNPVPVSAPSLIKVNHTLAQKLNIDPAWLESNVGVSTIAGNIVPDGGDPIATVYAGHQFGRWNPQLGDGRAILLGEILDKQKERYDFQLKGSGPTPYSRGGDGRAPLGPILREYIVSEAMAAFHITTTRILAAAATGDHVYRQNILPGAILVRIAKSHIRIGTFEFFSSRNDQESLRILTNHVIQRHYPEAAKHENPVLAMLDAVIENQANLISSWQQIGFIHGVMNTDNMLLSGETVDYGPCAFMDTYNPETVFSSIDKNGRYAYGNQPTIGRWNLIQLVQVLIPLLDKDSKKASELAQASIIKYMSLLEKSYQNGMALKLGICNAMPDDIKLIKDLLDIMAENRMDYTLTFRYLSDLAGNDAKKGVGDLVTNSDEFVSWLGRWRKRLVLDEQTSIQRQARMYEKNPAFIPRNHLIEEAIQSAIENKNFNLFHQLIDVLKQPFEYHSALKKYALAPRPDQIVHETFCGT
tara:strand:+ start:465 stop:1949 length:1485 start_codon:yes stop_codon:yes gene_type:complete